MLKPIKQVNRPSDDKYSIKWSKSHKSYKLIYDNETTIATTLCTQQEHLHILMDDYSPIRPFLAELNIEESDVQVNTWSISDYPVNDDRLFRINISKKENDSINELPYGVFRVKETRDGLFFKPYTKPADASFLVENSKNLKNLVVEFFNDKNLGRKDKMGILLYGPPGNGKTTDIMSLFEICEENEMRVFLIDGKFDISNLNDVKPLLNNSRVVFAMEELTERINGRNLEDLLTFLDGENSWNNSCTIATTNYPDQFPANLVDRPGRFDTFMEYTNPTSEEITKLAKKFEIDDASCLFEKNLSFDYISFILSKAKKSGMSVKETKEFEENKRKKLSETFRGKIGL